MTCNTAHNTELVAAGCAGNNCWPAYCDGQWPTKGNFGASDGALQFFADAVKGDDSAAGTEAAPFKTVRRGVEAVRDARKNTSTATAAVLTLRAGSFHLPQTLALVESTMLDLHAVREPQVEG